MGKARDLINQISETGGEIEGQTLEDGLNPHKHSFKISADGRGSTTSTISDNEHEDHVHQITDFKVEEIENHIHEIPSEFIPDDEEE
jgi:hypothetical protein